MDCRLVPVSLGLREAIGLKEGVTTIGRDSDNDVQLMSDFVSRHHAQINNMPNICEVEDLSSANGTFLNKERVDFDQLREGDEVCFGDTVFHFEICRSETLEDVSTSSHDYSDRAGQDTVRIKMHPKAASESDDGYGGVRGETRAMPTREILRKKTDDG